MSASSTCRRCTRSSKACGKDYGLVRHDGHLMPFPSKGFMLANISHFETPLDPLASASLVFEGRRQADATVEFLRTEFPRIFANARVRAYGNPGIRQTRWIVGKSQLTHRGHPRGASATPMRSRAAPGGWSCTTRRSWCTGSACRTTMSTRSP